MNHLNAVFQRALPHLLVLVGFVALSFLYSLPILEGKVLFQNDVLQAKGAAAEAVKYREATGQYPLWTNSMFSGMPTFMIAADYPSSLTTQLGRMIVGALPTPANLIFLYLAGAYAMFLMLGFSLSVSLVGAIGYAFASYNIINIEAGHVSKVITLGFAPPFIGAVVWAYRRSWYIGAAMAGLIGGLELYGNHIQITYYLLIALVAYVVYELVVHLMRREPMSQFVLASVGLAVAGLLALGTHTSRIWTNYEYTKQTIRGAAELTTYEDGKKKKSADQAGTDRDYAFQWSYGIGESLTFIIPNFVGGGSGAGAALSKGYRTYDFFESRGFPMEQLRAMPIYWGNQPFTSGPAYWGAVVVFLAVFGLLFSPNTIKWYLLGITIFFVVLAWGKNFAAFNNLMYDIVPLYNKFRAHTMVLSLAQIFVSWLAVLGIQSLFQATLDKPKATRALYISTLTVGGLALAVALLGGMMMSFSPTATSDVPSKDGKIRKMTADEMFIEQVGDPQLGRELLSAIRSDRATLQRNDAWRTTFFVAAAAVLIWLVINAYLTANTATLIMAAWALLDLWIVDRRYLNNENFISRSEADAQTEANNADLEIQKDKDPHYRVLKFGNPFNDAVTSYQHKSLGGYHAAKLRRYQDLIDRQLSKNNPAVVNMLNTKYFIGGNQQGEAVSQRNPGALGNAWLVSEIKIVNTADEEIKALDNLQPRQTAIVDKRFAAQLPKNLVYDSTASIRLTQYSPDALKYESNATREQVAIFSEVYYVEPSKIAWQAYLDGKPVPHFRANYVLRGMVIPAGKHTIEFKFEVPIFTQGEQIALVCSLMLVVMVMAAVWWHWRQSRAAGH